MSKIFLFLTIFLSLSLTAFAGTNINTASQNELEMLKGIGPVKARAIIEERERNGEFKSVEELTRVKGIGKGTLKQLADQITVDDSSVVNETVAAH